MNNSVDNEQNTSADLTPLGADLNLRKREGSAISPGIDALLDSKYQGRGAVNLVGACDASSSNQSTTKENRNLNQPQQMIPL